MSVSAERGSAPRSQGARSRVNFALPTNHQRQLPAPPALERRPRIEGGGTWGNQGFPHALRKRPRASALPGGKPPVRLRLGQRKPGGEVELHPPGERGGERLVLLAQLV